MATFARWMSHMMFNILQPWPVEGKESFSKGEKGWKENLYISLKQFEVLGF